MPSNVATIRLVDPWVDLGTSRTTEQKQVTNAWVLIAFYAKAVYAYFGLMNFVCVKFGFNNIHVDIHENRKSRKSIWAICSGEAISAASNQQEVERRQTTSTDCHDISFSAFGCRSAAWCDSTPCARCQINDCNDKYNGAMPFERAHRMHERWPTSNSNFELCVYGFSTSTFPDMSLIWDLSVVIRRKHLPEPVLLPNAIVLSARRISSLKCLPASHLIWCTIDSQVNECVFEVKIPATPARSFDHLHRSIANHKKRDNKRH